MLTAEIRNEHLLLVVVVAVVLVVGVLLVFFYFLKVKVRRRALRIRRGQETTILNISHYSSS